MRGWLLIAAVLLAGCQSAAAGASSAYAPPPPTGALAAWKAFPAGANPRPIVIFDRTLEYIPPPGFSAEPDRKLDWLCDKFVLAAGVTLLDSAPGEATAAGRTFPALGAREAYSELMRTRAAARAGGAAPDCASARPFEITNVRWQTAGFPTDRGTAQMSAWLFDVGEISAYLGYSALDPSAFWAHGVVPEGAGAGVSVDGMTLTVGEIGGPDTPGPCGEDFYASVAESDTAVAVAIATRFHTPPAGEFCAFDGHLRTVSVRLSKPLGGRVLVDSKGDAGAACFEGTAC